MDNDIDFVEVDGCKFYFTSKDTPEKVLNKIAYEKAIKVPYIVVEETKLLA